MPELLPVYVESIAMPYLFKLVLTDGNKKMDMKTISEAHLVDNMRFMPCFEDNFFELGLLDPEWGINASKPSKKPNKAKQKNGSILPVKTVDYKQKDWDLTAASKEYGDEVMRVTKNQIIWGANFFDWIVNDTFKPPRRDEFKDFIKQFPKGWIIWDKCNGNSDQFDCELAWTSFDKPTVIYQFMWAGMRQGSKANGAIMEGNKKLNEKRIHPTQKPTQLYRWQLQNYANTGDKILDTHMGSQSSRIAAYKMGFDYWGCEIDKEYFNDGNKRFNNETMQSALGI